MFDIYKINVKMTNLDVQALRVHVYPFYNERQIWILYMYAKPIVIFHEINNSKNKRTYNANVDNVLISRNIFFLLL